MVLLVVDTQKALMNSELFEFELFKSNITKLINTARDNDIEVIFIRHNDGEGNEFQKVRPALKYMMNLHHKKMKLCLINHLTAHLKTRVLMSI